MIRKGNQNSLEFGALLHQAFKAANISRDMVATSMQCSIDAIDNWCCGRARISANLLQELCSFLALKGVSQKHINVIYQKALESHGFSQEWPPNRSTKTSFTLCILGPITHAKELEMLETITRHSSQPKHQMMIVQSNESMESLFSSINLLNEFNITTILLCNTLAPPDVYKAILERISKAQINCILVLTDCPPELIDPYPNMYWIGWSRFELAYKATTLLLEAGHENVATVYLSKRTEWFSGYKKALVDKGICFDPSMVLEVGHSVSIPLLLADTNFVSELKEFVCHTNIKAIFAPNEALTTMIPQLLLGNHKKLYDDVSFCGLAYSAWVGQGLGLPVTYFSYPIEEVTHKLLSIFTRNNGFIERNPEERFIDVTNLAKIVNPGQLGSIRKIN